MKKLILKIFGWMLLIVSCIVTFTPFFWDITLSEEQLIPSSMIIWVFSPVILYAGIMLIIYNDKLERL